MCLCLSVRAFTQFIKHHISFEWQSHKILVQLNFYNSKLLNCATEKALNKRLELYFHYFCNSVYSFLRSKMAANLIYFDANLHSFIIPHNCTHNVKNYISVPTVIKTNSLVTKQIPQMGTIFNIIEKYIGPFVVWKVFLMIDKLQCLSELWVWCRRVWSRCASDGSVCPVYIRGLTSCMTGLISPHYST